MGFDELREMAAFFLPITSKPINDMKAISLKPAGTAINFRILSVLSQFLTNFGLHIAAIGAVLALVGVAIEADPLCFAGALAALVGIYPSTKSEKGGEEL